MIDLFPTLCAAAGVPEPAGLDGRTMLPLLRGEPQDGRDAVFTVFHETAAKGRYEMRCRQDDRFGYIWNEWSDGTREYRAENMTGRTCPATRIAGRTSTRHGRTCSRGWPGPAIRCSTPTGRTSRVPPPAEA
ncbi:hypothetical protein [Nonomuraea jabiensis]|uniref:hypothetical protein n=1 Tax=Nonomuraea jabiensis TaxID=882448 RepID=UPI003D73C363